MRNNNKKMGRLMALVLGVMVLVGACAGAAYAADAEDEPKQELSPADIYEQNVNSTVGIRITVTTNVWGYETKGAAAGAGNPGAAEAVRAA